MISKFLSDVGGVARRAAVSQPVLRGIGAFSQGAGSQGKGSQGKRPQGAAPQSGASSRLFSAGNSQNEAVHSKTGSTSHSHLRDAITRVDSPLLKAHVVIEDLTTLQAVRSRLPRANTATDVLLAAASDNSRDLSAEGDALTVTTESQVRECVRDPQTGAAHFLSAQVTVKPTATAVWKIQADDAAPSVRQPKAAQPEVRGEYYCIEPQSTTHVDVISQQARAADFALLRACAAHDDQLLKDK